MPNKPRLKYEKPVSIDMGRVAPILGDTCSVGNGAADCPAGMNNASVMICQPAGAGADNDCRTGTNAGTFCWPTGSHAQVYCIAGSGFGSRSAPSSFETSGDSVGDGIGDTSPYSGEPDVGEVDSTGDKPDAGGGTAFP